MTQRKSNKRDPRRVPSRLGQLVMVSAAVVVGCSSGEPEGSTSPLTEPAVDPGAGHDAEPGFDGAEPHVDPIGEALERVRREFAGEHGEPLPQFTAKCDLATGVHVPDFNCSAGTVVPTTNFTGGTYPNGNCDRPNRLDSACDANSRFQVLANNNDSVIVAHCRKKGLPGNLYGDIAVIQYNKVSGATCYYQAYSNAGIDGDFKSPSLGTSLASEADVPNPSASPWLSNASTKGIDCRRCHDNGAIIRSPYLAQLTGTNALPGAGDNNYNRTNPVAFIGDDYQSWKLYSVQVSGSVCNNCHRMGVSNTSNLSAGTARDFGIRATATSEAKKNPHSATSPIWMLPGQITYSSGSAAAAATVKTCADAIASGGTLPAGCSTTEITIPFTGLSPASLSVL